MIKVKNVHKKYFMGKNNVFEALRGVDFEVGKGESVAIIGKSGSGKSTLMHLMAGLDTPTEGDILYGDRKLSDMNEKELADFRNKKIGFVFQQFFLQPNLTVLENVVLPLKISGMSQDERIQKAEKALEEVEMLDKKNNKATDLSGGQKQRVSIARAIVGEPEVVFADEPTGNLDSETGESIIELLFNLNKKKEITLVVVTHDEDLAELCNKKIFIKDGQKLKEVTK